MLDETFLNRPIAHRGMWNKFRPENSLSAISAAADARFGVELDLQVSSDGAAMVFHDDTVDRMTDHAGWVAEYDAQTLSAMSIGEDDIIPTLAEVLDVIDGRVPILVELKDQTAHPGGTLGPLETAVAQELQRYHGPIAVMSFHPGMVKNLARMLPAIPRGLVGMKYDEDAMDPETAKRLNDYEDFDECGCSFVSHSWRDLSMPSVARLKERGVPILCWTTKAQAEENFARKIADNVTFEGYRPA